MFKRIVEFGLCCLLAVVLFYVPTCLCEESVCDDTDQIRNWKYFSRFHQFDELHHVLQGINPGRANQEERILSYNYGLALHDIVYASKIYDRVKDTEIDYFSYNRQDAKLWM